MGGIGFLISQKRSAETLVTITFTLSMIGQKRSNLRKNASLQIIDFITQLDTDLLNLEQFARKVTNRIRNKFGLYFVGLYVVNFNRTKAAILRPRMDNSS